MNRPYRICSRCVMDTSDPEIVFDARGRCNHCTAALERMRKQLLPPAQRAQKLAALVERVKRAGQGKEYDCIVGLSGGIDSTTTAYWVKKLGLRPLAVHFDNGWDSELAVTNIKRILDTLGLDLITHVVDWEEFRDLQTCFLRASVANCEIPTDHGIFALLFRTARQYGVRFILTGSNLATESIMPIAWGHYNQDLRHIRAIHARFGRRPLETFPTISVLDYLRYVLVEGIRQIPFLNLLEYDKDQAKALMSRELGWRDYGGKHHESVWTRFFQGHYLPTKFGYDKRRAHYSSMICSQLMSREQALEELTKPIYPAALLRQDLEFVKKKFKLTTNEFDAILHAAPRKATEFPSHHFLFHRMAWGKNLFRKIATSA